MGKKDLVRVHKGIEITLDPKTLKFHLSTNGTPITVDSLVEAQEQIDASERRQLAEVRKSFEPIPVIDVASGTSRLLKGLRTGTRKPILEPALDTYPATLLPDTPWVRERVDKLIRANQLAAKLVDELHTVELILPSAEDHPDYGPHLKALAQAAHRAAVKAGGSSSKRRSRPSRPKASAETTSTPSGGQTASA